MCASSHGLLVPACRDKAAGLPPAADSWDSGVLKAVGLTWGTHQKDTWETQEDLHGLPWRGCTLGNLSISILSLLLLALDIQSSNQKNLVWPLWSYQSPLRCTSRWTKLTFHLHQLSYCGRHCLWDNHSWAWRSIFALYLFPRTQRDELKTSVSIKILWNKINPRS